MMSLIEAYEILKHPEKYYSRHKDEARETVIKYFLETFEGANLDEKRRITTFVV